MATAPPQSLEPPWRVTSLERLFRRSSLFRWQLKTSDTPQIKSGLQDHWRGSATVGGRIIEAGDRLHFDGQAFDDFGWLRDLRAFGGSQARSHARQLIEIWLRQNQNWHPLRWQPDMMGDRLTNLVASYSWYGESATSEFQDNLARSIASQARCLALDWRRMNSPTSRLRALRGLATAEAALGGSESEMISLLDLAIPMINHMLNEDGGLKNRMPDSQIMTLRLLIELRSAASFANVVEDKRLDEIISRMGAVARMWRHGDGHLAHFNGAGMLNPEIIEETLLRAGPRGKVLQQAPYSGFLRFSSGRSTVIMDAGSPLSQDANGEDTACGFGTLSFEFSIGPMQLVVNAGQTAADTNLNRLLCSTSAHSTLALDEHNSSNPAQNRMANISGVEVGPAEGGLLAVASHDGYEASHGILHHRQIYLATGGANLRGSDRLEYTGAPGEIPRQAIIRFHLHPKVSAAMLGNGQVLMKIRGNRAGWIFKAANTTVSLDNSVFFDAGIRQSCQQIVLRTPISIIRTIGSNEVKWAFLRSDPR